MNDPGEGELCIVSYILSTVLDWPSAGTNRAIQRRPVPKRQALVRGPPTASAAQQQANESTRINGAEVITSFVTDSMIQDTTRPLHHVLLHRHTATTHQFTA